MKLALKIGVPIILLLIVLLLVYRATLMWNPFVMQNKTKSFLIAMQEQQFDEAARLFDGNSDKESLLQEMLELHEQKGMKRLTYSNVKAEYDDGSFGTGHANLTFESGRESLKVRAILTFSTEAKPKQICAITPPEAKDQAVSYLESWNNVFCGGSFNS